MILMTAGPMRAPSHLGIFGRCGYVAPQLATDAADRIARGVLAATAALLEAGRPLMRRPARAHRRPGLNATRAVVFSAMTTATAFGSLWLSNDPGISRMGALMALALVCTLAAAVLFQPLLMGPPRERALATDDQR